ncbi:MAG TPA: hypothetical protein VKW06_05335 [Candidatus Angelobacter sp.]|nr:hypothetical protein [Candidatus Angelobacter sp.]
MRGLVAASLMLLLLTLAAEAQEAAIGFCALDQTLDFKTAKAGNTVALHLTRDLEVNGKTVMPRGTALLATVVEARDGNAVSIGLDKAKPKNGQEVPLMGIIAAVATPPRDLSDDPFYSMSHSVEPTQRTANAPMTSSANSGAAVQTDQLETRKRSQVEPAGGLQRSHRDRWTQAELGPRQGSSDHCDDRQEEELQAAERDRGPVAHGAAAHVAPSR